MHEKKHTKRIEKELREVGMTLYGFMKLETEHLPEIIHKNEHIKGVVYGRLEKSLDAAMLVVTDKRILFIDAKPMYVNIDEITYEVVAGISVSAVGPFAGVVLHTRIKDYSLRFVNINCAQIFSHYIENHIETGIKHLDERDFIKPVNIKKETKKNKNDDKNYIYGTAILSTAGKNGVLHGSVVHYTTDKNDNYYFITKTKTKKHINITENNNVALTIHSPGSLKSLEIIGLASEEKDPVVRKVVFHHITNPKKYYEGEKLPSITKLEKGSYVIYKIEPISTNAKDYSKASW